MTSKNQLEGRRRRTLYVTIAREVQVATRQKALIEDRTMSEVVEDALRCFLGLPSSGEDES